MSESEVGANAMDGASSQPERKDSLGSLLAEADMAALLDVAQSTAVAAERERLRALIADDAWACTFQTFGQYRTALLETLKA